MLGSPRRAGVAKGGAKATLFRRRRHEKGADLRRLKACPSAGPV